MRTPNQTAVVNSRSWRLLLTGAPTAAFLFGGLLSVPAQEAPGFSRQGRVLDPYLHAVSGVHLLIDDPLGRSQTTEVQENGAFTLTGPAGTWTVELRMDQPRIGDWIGPEMNVELGQDQPLVDFLYPVQTADHEIRGRIQDYRDKNLEGITIHARLTDGDLFYHLQTRTGPDGAFAIGAVAGTWRLEADPDELIQRGFSCLPGDLITIGYITNIYTIAPLIAIPIRPTLSLPEVRPDGAVLLRLTFDSSPLPLLGNPPRYQVETSTDLQKWLLLGTIDLTHSPIDLEDPAPDPFSRFYRATLVDP